MPLQRIRIDELSSIGASTKASLGTDLADFTAFSPKYDNDYVTTFGEKLDELETVQSTRFHIKLIEQITLKILMIIIGLRPLIRKLARYIDLAEDVTGMDRKQMGILEVRKCLSSKDTEALNQALYELFENVELHKVALETVGFTPVKFTEVKDMKVQLKKNMDMQTEKMQDKVRAVADNMVLFEAIEDIILEVMETGKALYQYEHKERLPEYTLSTKLEQIRQERSPEQVQMETLEKSCAVFVNYTDEDGGVLADVNSKIPEYELVLESDDEGASYFEAVATEPFNKITVVSELDGFVTDVQENVELIAGGEVEINVVLKKVV